MQVERVVAGDVVGQNSAVDVDRALGPARGAAGEVQERHVVGIGRRNLEPVRGFRHQVVPGQRPRHAAAPIRMTCARSGSRSRICSTLRRYSASLVTSTRPCAHLQAGGDRLRAEGGEQGRHHASVLQRPQRCHVELRHAAGQDEYALAHADTESSQDIGEAVGGGSQLAEAEIPALAGAPEPAQCQMIGARTPRVAIHGLVRDVQAATVGQPVQHPPRPVPLEVTADRVVVGQVRLQPKARRSLPDRRIPAAQSLSAHRFDACHLPRAACG